MRAVLSILGAVAVFGAGCASGDSGAPTEGASWIVDVGASSDAHGDGASDGALPLADAGPRDTAGDAADTLDGSDGSDPSGADSDAGQLVAADAEYPLDGAAVVLDGISADVAPADVPDVSAPKGELWAQITSPSASASFGSGAPIELVGQVGGTDLDPQAITATWTLNGVQLGAAQTPGPDGAVTASISDPALGSNVVFLTATAEGYEAATAVAPFTVCDQKVLTFDTDLNLAAWKAYGDAHWDAGGWLELTGLEQSKAGSIYKIDKVVYPGDVAFRMKVATGGGINGGADGFAMNIYNVSTVADLDELVAAAPDGGCLGYGVSGPCNTLVVDSFHIEFDTFQNQGDPLVDPTWQNHVAVTLDGDPGNHVLWAEVPNLEDGAWHDVEVTVLGTVIRVHWDGVAIITKDVPGFLFKGGYLGFSGSTGWATNYHRIDDLQVEQGCVAP